MQKGSLSDVRAILDQLRLGVRQLRSAQNISSFGSKAQSQHDRCAQARARKSIEKTGVSALKIEPERFKTTPERAKVDVGRPGRAEKRSPNARRAVERKILVRRAQQKRQQPVERSLALGERGRLARTPV